MSGVQSGTEVLVVGGGIVGAATAYFLAQEGVPTTIVDEHPPAWGASGRNPGYVWTHTRAEGVQMELALAGRRLYDDLIGALDDFEFRPSGGLIYFFEDEHDLFPRFVAGRRAAGLPVELLDGDAARAACPILPDDVAGATFNPMDAHLEPTKLTQALAHGAERLGATVRQQKVLGLRMDSGRCVGVDTDDGPINADHVVVAAGSWSAQLLASIGLRLPIVPMRLQMALTAPIEERFDPILYGPTAVKQYALTKDLPGYDEEEFLHPLETIFPGLAMLELAAQRKDGRVLLGCPMDFVGMNDQPTVGGLALTCGIIGDHLPSLRDVAIERVWAGLLPQTPDALPVLGPVDGVEGLVLATGHVFGVAAGPMSGKLIAQHLTGATPALDLAPFRYERSEIADAVEDFGHW
jgi:glycine/D-amino acid oxidase-like deaminating enzyme